MKQFLSRQIVMNRLRKIRRQAVGSASRDAIKIADKMINAVLTAPLEKHIYCECCGKKIKEELSCLK